MVHNTIRRLGTVLEHTITVSYGGASSDKCIAAGALSDSNRTTGNDRRTITIG
jgi:hypothetical protein